MKDSIIAGTGNSQYLKTSLAAGTTWEAALAQLRAGTFPIDLNGINQAGFTQVGTVLNTQTLLANATAESLGLTDAAVPTDAFNALLVLVNAALTKDQGADNAGKVLIVTSDGSVGFIVVDDTPTEGSDNLITSGGVYSYVGTLADTVSGIQTALETAQEDIQTLQTDVTELKSAIEANTEDIEKLYDAIYDGYAVLLDGTEATYRKVMKAFFINRGALLLTPTGLTALMDEWYAMTRDNWNGYTTFYQKGVSSVSTGTKGGDNAGMTCVPSTDTVANTDDYAGLPLFAPTDVNWEIDATTLEPVITGIKDVVNFERDNPDKLVGVVQMSGWHWRDELEQTFVDGYSAQEQSGHDYCEPVPEAVRVDNTMREWVIHTKYMGHMVNGKMRAYAGVIPTAWQSHNTLQTNSRANGSQYGGGSVLLNSWLTLMTRIKYASLTLDGIIQGCLSYNYQYVAAAGETGVKRVLLTSAQAANLYVGSGVLIGTLNSALSKDRNTAVNYNITGQAGAIITAKETVEVGGNSYVAVYVDTSNTFNTVGNGTDAEGSTLISTFHWPTGTNDAVLGNDGSIVSATNGRFPAKLQGIEFICGSYEVFGDVILSLSAPDTTYTYGAYTAYLVNRAAQQTTSISANYKDSGNVCPKIAEAAAWNYISVEGFSSGLYMPTDVIGGSSTTYTRDAMYQNVLVSVATLREWLAFAGLYHGSGDGGLSDLSGIHALSAASWYFAGRPSACANRGGLGG